MKKKLKAKCKICGEIELDDSPFNESDDEGFIIPTFFCPTLRSLTMFYHKFCGESYFEQTGNKIKDDFERGYLVLNHCNPDEDGENWKDHKLEPIECWRMMM